MQYADSRREGQFPTVNPIMLTPPAWFFDTQVSHMPPKAPEQPAQTPEEDRLVDAEGLLDALFDEASRPSLRWIRDMQKRKAIPFYKIGRHVRFSIPEVREAIEEKFKVKRRRA